MWHLYNIQKHLSWWWEHACLAVKPWQAQIQEIKSRRDFARVWLLEGDQRGQEAGRRFHRVVFLCAALKSKTDVREVTDWCGETWRKGKGHVVHWKDRKSKADQTKEYLVPTLHKLTLSQIFISIWGSLTSQEIHSYPPYFHGFQIIT